MEIGKIIDKAYYYACRATGDYVYDAKRLLADLSSGKKSPKEIWGILSAMYDHAPTGRASKIASYILEHISDDDLSRLSTGIKDLKISINSPIDDENVDILISVEDGNNVRFKRKNTALDYVINETKRERMTLLDIEFVIGYGSVQYSKAEHNTISLTMFNFYGEIQTGVDYARNTPQYQMAKYRLLGGTLSEGRVSRDGFIKLQAKVFQQAAISLL